MNQNYQSDNSGNVGEWESHRIYAAQAKDVIVEIGVLFGDTTKVLLEAAKPTTHIYGIDPIIPDSMNEALIGSVDKINELVVQYPNFTFIKDYSFNVVKTWDKEIDYIFIDGDHEYAAVKQDYEQWLPFVKIGGTIAIHDSAANRGGPFYWPGPSQLSDELIQATNLEFIQTRHTMTIFKKIA
jgi:predicted O-methyltransferase YrrM